MRPNEIIDYERSQGRTTEEIVRRLYTTEMPFALRDKADIYFDIFNVISTFFRIPIYQVKAAGSAQTGHSFHNNRDFVEKDSDFDVAIISSDVFEKYLRAVQNVALPNPEALDKPQRNIFPIKDGHSYYPTFMEYVTFHGVLMPYQMPLCPEKSDLNRMLGRLSTKYAELFKNINVAIYLSGKFFERKQQPNIGFYDSMVER